MLPASLLWVCIVIVINSIFFTEIVYANQIQLWPQQESDILALEEMEEEEIESEEGHAWNLYF